MSTAFKGTVEFAYIEYDAVRRFNEPSLINGRNGILIKKNHAIIDSVLCIKEAGTACISYDIDARTRWLSTQMENNKVASGSETIEMSGRCFIRFGL